MGEEIQYMIMVLFLDTVIFVKTCETIKTLKTCCKLEFIEGGPANLAMAKKVTISKKSTIFLLSP